MKKQNTLLIIFLAHTVYISSLEGQQNVTLHQTDLPESTQNDNSSDNSLSKEELDLESFTEVAKHVYKKLEKTNIHNDNIGKILYLIKHNDYKKVLITPYKKDKTNRSTITLKENSKKNVKDHIINLTPEEFKTFKEEWTAFKENQDKDHSNKTASEPKKDSTTKEAPFFQNKPQNEKNKLLTAKRSTPESREKRLNGYKQQQPQRYNSPRPKGYNPMIPSFDRRKFQATPKENSTVFIVEGTLPKETPQKKEINQEWNKNKTTKKHACSRVPEAQKKSVKRIYPSLHNLKHEKRTKKIGRTFYKLKKKDISAKPLIKKETKTNKENFKEDPQTFIASASHCIKDFGSHIWNSFINLFNWKE